MSGVENPGPTTNINETPIVSAEQPEVEASKAAAQSAIDELQKIVNFDSANKDAATVKKEITALKNEATKKIDGIMKPNGLLGIFGMGGSKKKAKKSKRKSQKK